MKKLMAIFIAQNMHEPKRKEVKETNMTRKEQLVDSILRTIRCVPSASFEIIEEHLLCDEDMTIGVEEGDRIIEELLQTGQIIEVTTYKLAK